MSLGRKMNRVLGTGDTCLILALNSRFYFELEAGRVTSL